MEGICPHCAGQGCDRCNDGKVEFTFKEGDNFTRQCNNPRCLFQNGGRIVDYGTVPSEDSEPCVICGEQTEWVMLENARQLPEPPPYETNKWEFAYKRADQSIKKLVKINKQLRELAVPMAVRQKLTVDEARLLKICRICHGKDSPRTKDGAIDVFSLKLGAEYAHESCLKEERHAI